MPAPFRLLRQAIARIGGHDIPRISLFCCIAATMISTGTARSETVLERVLAAWNGAPLTGTYVNAAMSADFLRRFDPALTGIDGSITNIILGVDPVRPHDFSTYAMDVTSGLGVWDIGNQTGLGLGGVNSGAVFLDRMQDKTAGIQAGANAAVDQAMTSATASYQGQVTQLGGTDRSAKLALNIASNALAVQGRVTNTMARVNASVGTITATAIGAVNTGEIRAGVSDVVAGLTR